MSRSRACRAMQRNVSKDALLCDIDRETKGAEHQIGGRRRIV
jgi:hypothetical protein